MPKNLKPVSVEEFYLVINPLDVVLSFPFLSKLDYTIHFKTRTFQNLVGVVKKEAWNVYKYFLSVEV